jgi:hypothetical protein
MWGFNKIRLDEEGNLEKYFEKKRIWFLYKFILRRK